MDELINFYLELLNGWKDILRKYELYLGGGTALMIKYRHRISYDLDFFVFKEITLKEVLNELAYSIPYNFDFSLNFPSLTISNRKFSTRVEIHRRSNVKLLGFEEIFGILKLSDLDILLEKIYFIERKKESDIFDIRFLKEKLGFEESEIKNKLTEKFGISEDYALYLILEVKKLMKF